MTEYNQYNYSQLVQNYSRIPVGRRSIRTFLSHGIERNNSRLFLNDTSFMDLLYTYSDKCKKIYNDYRSMTNKNNNIKRQNKIKDIIRSESIELFQCIYNMETSILSKIKEDKRRLNRVVSSGSYGYVYNNSTNVSMKIKLQHIMPENRVFDIYLEFLIMNILYNQSILAYKRSIPKPYYLYKNGQTIRMYVRNIPNSYTLNEFIYKIIYNKRKIVPSNKIENMSPKYIRLFEILLKICNLLNYFQNNFNFIHNDFHIGNILIQKDVSNPNPYIIDFGFASIETNINSKSYYLTNKLNQIIHSRMNDSTNIFNICKSIDIMHLIIRIMLNCQDRDDTLLLNILKDKFFNYNQISYTNLFDDILIPLQTSIEYIYYFTTDYHGLFNYISSLDKYKRIFTHMPTKKSEFKNEVLLNVLSNFRPNNAVRIFNEIIKELEVHML